jgi:hypothetical protein
MAGSDQFGKGRCPAMARVCRHDSHSPGPQNASTVATLTVNSSLNATAICPGETLTGCAGA